MRIIYGTAAFLTVLIICSAFLSGCGEDNAKTTDDIVTIRILENDTAKSQGYLQELLDAFNAKYESQGIVAVDANMEEYSNLAENGPYGYGPDVIYQANDKLMTYAEDKHVMALDVESYECYSKTPSAALDAFKITVDGKTYYCGIPINVQEPMLFYRKDRMPADWQTTWDDNQNGVADFFENWNELYAYSLYLREHDESANKDAQYGLVASLNDLYMMAEFIFSYGGYVFGTDDNGVINSEDIGFGAGNSALGMLAMRQFAGIMSEECIDDSVKTGRYSKVADGTYFCSISTPDTYTLFHQRLADVYEAEGRSAEEAAALATENLGMIELPRYMPADGDLSKDASAMKSEDFVEAVVMGGINGYGISAYTKHKEACKLFVDFASSYEMVSKRAEILGIAPTRSDVAEKTGGVSDTIWKSLNEGRIYLMPSVKAVDQIWTPMQTLLSDVAKDAFRERNGETVKYADTASMQAALDKASKSVYDAIYTLAK